MNQLPKHFYYPPSLSEIEIALNEGRKFQYENGTKFYLRSQGIEIANLFVINAKQAVIDQQFAIAIDFVDCALKIIEEHPWAIYYKLLASIASNKRFNAFYTVDYLNNLLALGLRESIHVGNETQFNSFIEILQLKIENISLHDVEPMVVTGKTDYRPISFCNWDLNLLRDSICNDLLALDNLITERKIDGNGFLPHEAIVLLYSINFYICKYFAYVIIKNKLVEGKQINCFVQVYKSLAMCIYHPTSPQTTQKIAKLVASILKYPAFWQFKSDSCLHLSRIGLPISPELKNWLQKNKKNIDLFCDREGAFIVDANRVTTFKSTEDLLRSKFAKHLNSYEFKHNKTSILPVKLILYFHSWGGLEIHQIS